MPKILINYVRYMDSFTLHFGKGMRWAIFMLIGILLIEAVGRYVLNRPTEWSLELATFLFGAYFITGGAYALLRREHVRMDTLYSKWHPKKQAIADIATFSLFAVYVIMFILGGIASSTYSIVTHHHTASMWGPPYAPIKVITTVGAAMLFLQGVAQLIRDIATIKKKPIP